MADVVIDEKQIGHIFRNATGHFSEDNPETCRALIEVASREQNFIGTDPFGNDWFAVLRADGTQLWTCVRDGKITNGGFNRAPRRRVASGLMPRVK